MKRTYTNRRYLDALQERIIIFDGAMGTNIQAQKLSVEQFGGERTFGCNDYLVISYPQAVEKVHRSFLDAGVDALETDTFRATRYTLSRYGLAQRVTEINLVAAQLACRLAKEYATPNHPVFVGGSIGPTGKLPSMDDPELSVPFDELVEVFYEQALGLVQGGVDLLVVETSQDMLELKAALTGIQKVFDETGVYLPIQAQVTLDPAGRMLLGTDISAAMAILEGMAVDVIGINCSTGPEDMRPAIQYLGENASLPISCIPNAGLPVNVEGEAVYTLAPEPFVETLAEFVEKHRVSVVGGCCGTTPAHIKLLVERLSGYKSAIQTARRKPHLASRLRAVDLRVQPAPFLVSNICDPVGNPEYQRLLQQEDYDGILDLARGQVKAGAQAVVLSTETQARECNSLRMEKTARKLALGLRVPLVIASEQAAVMEAALKVIPGRSLLVAANLSITRSDLDAIFRLAKQYSAAVLCQACDENGAARTLDLKLEILHSLFQMATGEYDLQPQDLVFDPLTLPLAPQGTAESASALAVLDALLKIKQMVPETSTALNISRIAVGMKPKDQTTLNSVYLHHAVQAGLDIAFVDPTLVVPYDDLEPEEVEIAEEILLGDRRTGLDI